MDSHIVVCASCKRPLYKFTAPQTCHSGDSVKCEHFEPVCGEVTSPKIGEEMRCAYCGEYFAVAATTTVPPNGAVLLLEDGSWWPHPPLD